MFCPNCGEKINEDTSFCGACGANVKSDTTYLKKDNLKYFITAGVIIVLIISILAYKKATDVNSTQEKVAKNFVISIKKNDYKQFKESFYKADSNALELIECKDEKAFRKISDELNKSAEKEMGKNWDKKLTYKVSKDKVEVSNPLKTNHPLNIPIIQVGNKYYVDIYKME